MKHRRFHPQILLSGEAPPNSILLPTEIATSFLHFAPNRPRQPLRVVREETALDRPFDKISKIANRVVVKSEGGGDLGRRKRSPVDFPVGAQKRLAPRESEGGGGGRSAEEKLPYLGFWVSSTSDGKMSQKRAYMVAIINKMKRQRYL